MKKILFLLFVSAFLFLHANPAFCLNLFDLRFNASRALNLTPDFDSSPKPKQLASYMDDTAFDWAQGLKTLTMIWDSATAGYYFGMYVEHEIDQNFKSFFNEHGEVNSTPGAGRRSWKIDNPGFSL